MVHRVGVWAALLSVAVVGWSCDSDSACDPSLKRLDGSRCDGDSRAGASAAGGSTGVAGGAHGGALSGDSGASGEAGEAGDSGSAGEAGSSGIAGGDDVPESVPTRWLTLNGASSGTYAYDVTKFPDPTALVALSPDEVTTHTLYDWSPDGRRILYESHGVLYSRDMTQAVPSSPVKLATVPNPAQSTPTKPLISWSGDSLSVALVSGETLSVLGPTEDAPLLHTLTSTLRSYRWAGIGKRLFYVDASGVHVLEVTAGVPGVPTLVDATPWESTTNWSPNGAVLAGSKNGTFVAATFDAALEPTLQSLPAGDFASPTVSAILFSRVGRKIAFIGARQRALSDLYVVSYGTGAENVSAPKRVHPELGGTQSVDFASFSADGGWLVYRLVDAGSPSAYQAVDLADTELGAPITVAGLTDASLRWLPGSASFVGHTLGTDLAEFDLSTNEPTPFVSSEAVSAFGINPRRSVLAYTTQLALHLRDLSLPSAPGFDLPLLQGSSGSLSGLAWSPDGKLISVLEHSDQYRLHLLRVDGAAASSPFTVKESAADELSSSFQP